LYFFLICTVDYGLVKERALNPAAETQQNQVTRHMIHETLGLVRILELPLEPYLDVFGVERLTIPKNFGNDNTQSRTPRRVGSERPGQRNCRLHWYASGVQIRLDRSLNLAEARCT
jgi:hypothetical protein